MEMVDSNQKKLTGEQIAEIAIANTKVGRPMKQAKDMLVVEFSLPNVWKMRQGNTLFVCHKTKYPGYGYFRALNADTARNFVQNIKIFLDAAYKVGFDVLVTQFHDKAILNIANVISRNITQPDRGYVVQKTKDGGYQLTVQVGTLRGHK